MKRPGLILRCKLPTAEPWLNFLVTKSNIDKFSKNMSSYIFIDALIKKDDNNINSAAVNIFNSLFIQQAVEKKL